jgi:hypothetical protein
MSSFIEPLLRKTDMTEEYKGTKKLLNDSPQPGLMPVKLVKNNTTKSVLHAVNQAGGCGDLSYILFLETQSKRLAALGLCPSGKERGLVRST